MVPKLQIVVLESPYDTLGDANVRDLFSRLIEFKIRGYQAIHPYGVLPIDSYDFIATHQFVCQETNGHLEILLGMKYVTLQKCITHRLTFPGLTLLRAAGASPHDVALQAIIDSHADRPETLSYGSSWTIAPEARDNRVLKSTLKDLMTATLVHYENELQTTERLCCGVPKVKTDEYLQTIGYEKLSYNNEVLPAFNQASLLGEQAVMLRSSKFSDKALEIAENYRKLWESRLVYRSKDLENAANALEKKAA